MRTGELPRIMAALIATAAVGPATAAAQAVAGEAVKPLAVAGEAVPLQAVATDEPRPRPHRPPFGGIGAGVALGVVSAAGVDPGWLARIDFEIMPGSKPPGRVGAFFGIVEGLELWRAGDDNWGVALPMAVELGARAPGLRAAAMVGLEAITIDQVADDTGVGLYAPLAGARVVLDLHGWTAGADARVIRRWQIGADDHTQLQVAFVLGYGVETGRREPIR